MQNQATFLAVTRLLDAFPQTTGDPDFRLKSFLADVADIEPGIVQETADRFRKGLVEGQSTRFAPSIAEFATEARRLAKDKAETLRFKALPPRRSYVNTGDAPFERYANKVEHEMRDWIVHEKDVSHSVLLDRFKRGDLPRGWKWRLGTIYVPPRAAE